MRFRNLLVGILVGWASLATASIDNSQRVKSTPELNLPVSVLHHSAAEPRLQAGRGGCEQSQAPHALATPDPLLDWPASPARIAVSFIIGADGRVHSPIILESAGDDEDRSVLDAVLAWRYRPATCNATPTETESKVEFSLR